MSKRVLKMLPSRDDDGEWWYFVTTDEDGILQMSRVKPDTAKHPAVLKTLIRRIFVLASSLGRDNRLPAGLIDYLKLTMSASRDDDNGDTDDDHKEFIQSYLDMLKKGNVDMPETWSREDWGEWELDIDVLKFPHIGKGQVFFYVGWW